MFKFNARYFIVFVFIFLIEALIALYARDRIIRPYVGDILVVMLVYTLVKSFFDWNNKKVALGVFIFAVIIEISQYFEFIYALKLESYKVAHWVLGSGFEWLDILAYALGIFITLFIESKAKKQNI